MFQPVAKRGRVCDQCEVAGTRVALIAAIVREAHMSVLVPQDIFSHHIDAVSRGDMMAILEDYSPDAVLLTPQGALEGHSGVEAFFRQASAALGAFELRITRTVFGGSALLAHWTASSTAARNNDGIDSFVFADGRIQVQTSSFTIQPN